MAKWFFWCHDYQEELKWDSRITASRRCVSQWPYRRRWNDCNSSQLKMAFCAEMRCLTELQDTFYTAYSGDMAWVFFTGSMSEKYLVLSLSYKIVKLKIKTKGI